MRARITSGASAGHAEVHAMVGLELDQGEVSLATRALLAANELSVMR
jgi:hypothetical protein